MTNERFYPAKERKNDFIVKGVSLIQLRKQTHITHKKSVFKNGEIFLGIRAYDTYSVQRGHHTILENVYG